MHFILEFDVLNDFLLVIIFSCLFWNNKDDYCDVMSPV